LPELAVPELKTNKPLVPIIPEFAVFNSIDPLLVTELYPLTTDTRPPVLDDEAPAESTNSPPEPLLPEPTVKYTEPPRPPLAVPDPRYKAPELPELEVPVLITNRPATPLAPEFAVYNKIDPLLDIEL
jgi:hypothetical protein